MKLPALLCRALGLLLLWAVATTSAQAQGSVVAAGSALRDDNHAVWNRIVELAGGPGSRFAVFTASSGQPDSAATAIGKALRAHGAGAAEHIRIGPAIAKTTGQDLAAAVRDPAWIAQVDAATGVYFSGGDQRAILDLLMPGGTDTPLMQAVRRVFARGGVVGGESAGCAVMSDPAFRDLPQPVMALKWRAAQFSADGEHAAIGKGFGFLPLGVMVDQHFLSRGRIGRLIPAMWALKQPLGLGVEDGTAAVVRGDTVEVLGVKGVVVVDLAEAQSDGSVGAFNLRGVKLSYLDRGDRFDLKTKTITPAANKLTRAVAPNAPGFVGRFDRAPFAADILARDALLHTMSMLVDSDLREARGLAFAATPSAPDSAPDLGFEWLFTVGPDTRGWSSPASGGDYTLARIQLDIQPVKMRLPLYGPWRAASAANGAGERRP